MLRRIADFVVEKRKLVIAAVLVVMVACAALYTQVGINTDMTKYLSDKSSMKQGINIMEDEFTDLSAENIIRVMMEGLSGEEAAEIKAELEAIPYVGSVAYEPTSDYVKDQYTLFEISTDFEYGSTEERSIEDVVKETYQDHNVLVETNEEFSNDVLQPWIVALALAILMIVLFIMCSSWFEPIVFLMVIGIAVIINLGTNIVLGSISSVTASIAAILQLVLSMDYSIILMNRYRQELAHTPNKLEAMKNAIVHASSSITASALTTFVGLLMLVFMDFKIGFDFGVVLAKGVLCSLFCIFTVLPGLILGFSRLIEKTAKRAPHFSMKGISAFSQKFRFPLTGAFAVLFVAAFFLQGFTPISFAMENERKIPLVFPQDNNLVVVFDNEEDNASLEALVDELEQNENVTATVSYPTAFDRQYTAGNMAATVEDIMGASDSMSLDESMLKVLYYAYHSDGKAPSVTAAALLNFIADDLVTNEMFAAEMDSSMVSQAATMKKFANAENLTAPKTASEMANFLGSDELNADAVEQIYLLYFAKNGGVDAGFMTVSEFAIFLTDEVLANPTYASSLDASTKAQAKQLTLFKDPAALTRQVTSDTLASMLGMSGADAQMLYAYYYATQGGYEPSSMTLPEFVAFANSGALSGQLDASTQASLQMLAQYTNTSFINTPLEAAAMAQALGMDEAVVSQFYTGMSISAINPYQFVQALLTSGQLSASQSQQLGALNNIMQATLSNAAFTYSEMATFFGGSVDAAAMKIMFTLHDAPAHEDSWTMSAQQALNFIASNQSLVASALGGNTASLAAAQKLANAAVEGVQFSAEEMANIAGMSKEDARLMYLMKQSAEGNTSTWALSVQKFVNFVLSDVISDPAASKLMEASAKKDLQTLKTLIDAVVTGKSYSPSQLTSLFSALSADVDKNQVELLCMLYGSKYCYNDSWTMSLEELIGYIANDIANDERFASFLDASFKADIATAEQEINDGINQLRGDNHSLLNVTTSLPAESSETMAFVSLLDELCAKHLQGEYHIVGSSAMYWEMQNGFSAEMLFISILTAAAIFTIVALTFRSLLIPLALVLIVLCGVYVTVAISGLKGDSLIYLAYIIVQCILMGATIDYGILFTNYYREKRKTLPVKEAINEAYNGSIHTILTSGLIMVLVTGIIGSFANSPAISPICITISLGATSVILLILFVLPGMLAALDKFIVKDK